MKIAVYTIALNEEKHVKRWYESAKDADYLLIADTGSTDKTVRLAKKLGINVIKISIKPWRFDDARNAALAALPEDIDYCVSLDMDETLSEGWRECLEKMTESQIEYRFNLTFKDEDETHPDETFINNRIHKRYGFRWNYFIHEAVMPDRLDEYTLAFCEGLEVSHRPDPEKSREQYSQMIEDAYVHYKIPRYHMYQASQLLQSDRIDEARDVLKSFVKIKEARKQDIALAYRILGMTGKFKIFNYLRSLMISPTRETYTQLAIHYYKKESWIRTYLFAKRAESMKVKTTGVFKDQNVWTFLPFNLMMCAKHNMKMFKYSKKYRLNKKELNLKSQISTKFKLFND